MEGDENKVIDYSKYCAPISNTFKFKVDDFDFECEELSLVNEGDYASYMYNDNSEKNFVKYRLVQLTGLTKQPFNSSWISNVFNIHHTKYKIKSFVWEDMSSNEKLMFLEKLEDEFMKKVINEVTEHYNKKEVALKN